MEQWPTIVCGRLDIVWSQIFEEKKPVLTAHSLWCKGDKRSGSPLSSMESSLHHYFFVQVMWLTIFHHLSNGVTPIHKKKVSQNLLFFWLHLFSSKIWEEEIQEALVSNLFLFYECEKMGLQATEQRESFWTLKGFGVERKDSFLKIFWNAT